jgi:hypothetical protein
VCVFVCGGVQELSSLENFESQSEEVEGERRCWKVYNSY